MNLTDIFPIEISSRVGKLAYPDKFLANTCSAANPFVLFMDSRNKLYYNKCKLEDKYARHMEAVGKNCRTFNEFRPNDLDWTKVSIKLKRTTTDTFRKNVDIRTGFKIGNCFLVKANFTFGQRTVAPGTEHVYQILNVPLLFFLMERKSAGRLRVEERVFPYQELHLYDRRILCPRTCYRIPAGTTYVVFSTQKNYFRLDVVYEGLELPFECVDPVQTRVVKLNRFSGYDLPVKTPYIGHEDQEPVEMDLDESVVGQPSMGWIVIQQQQQQQPIVEEPMPEPMPESVPEPVPESEPEPMPEPEETPFVFEKNIILATPPFVRAYQSLHSKIYDDPKKIEGPKRTVGEVVEPLDMTLGGQFIQDAQNVDEMLEDIFNQIKSSSTEDVQFIDELLS